MQRVAVAGLVLISTVWGLTFILIKWALAEIDPYQFLCARFAIAFFVMAIVFCKRLLKTNRQTFLSAAVLSFFLSVGYITQTVGLKMTTASNSALITGLFIVLIPIFQMLFLKTKTQIKSVIGIILATVGLYLLTQYNFTGINFGDTLTLVCAIAFAWHVIFIGRFSKNCDLIGLVSWQFFFVALICTGMMPRAAWHIPTLSTMAWITLLVSAVFATAIAFMIQTAAQRIVDPARTGLIFTMEPLTGTLFACWLGSETLSTAAMAGAVLMFAGIIISEFRWPKAFEPPEQNNPR